MTQIHPNYIKASKLMMVAFTVSGISLIRAFISIFTMRSELTSSSLNISDETAASLSEGHGSGVMIAILVVSLYYVLIIGLIQKGTTWVKYLILALFLLNTYSDVSKGFPENTDIWSIIETTITIIVRVLTAWVLVLLFGAPKQLAITQIEVADQL